VALTEAVVSHDTRKFDGTCADPQTQYYRPPSSRLSEQRPI